MKINIKSNPPEIWIRIRFLEINGSPSLSITLNFFFFFLQNLTFSNYHLNFEYLVRLRSVQQTGQKRMPEKRKL